MDWTGVIWALLPTTCVIIVFVIVLRGIIRMDRTERRVFTQIEAEERAKRAASHAPAGGADSTGT